MSKTEAIRLALELGSRGRNAQAIGIRYHGKGYSFTTWSVRIQPTMGRIPGVR